MMGSSLLVVRCCGLMFRYELCGVVLFERSSGKQVLFSTRVMAGNFRLQTGEIFLPATRLRLPCSNGVRCRFLPVILCGG